MRFKIDFRIDLEIGQELTFRKLNDYMEDLTKYSALRFLKVEQILKDGWIIYRINENIRVHVDFKVIEKNEEDLIESKIKITDIKITYTKKDIYKIWNGTN